MKLALALTFVAGVAANVPTPATRNCVIPPAYVTSSGTTCTSQNAGYMVYGVCLNGLPRAEYATTTAQEVKKPLTGNTMAFSSGGLSTRAGCVVPNSNYNWNIGGMALATAAGLDMTLCTAYPTQVAMDPAFNAASAGTVKGVAIECDRAAATPYFPVRGYEGTNLCINWAQADPDATTTNGGIWPDAPAALAGDFFAPPAFFEAPPTSTTPLAIADYAAALGYATFTGPNALRCAQGCTLPAELCNNGRLNANIVGTVNGQPLTGCVLPPVQVAPNVLPNTFSFQCASGFGRGTVFTATCTVTNFDAVPVVAAYTSTYANQCGVAYGAQTVPLWNNNGNLNGWNAPITQAAGQIQNFPSVTSILSIAYRIPLSAYFTPFNRRHWNNNPAKQLVDGTVYQIAVTGCDAAPTDLAKIQCTQQTLNWWRCNYDFPFNGGTICWANFNQIACPTHALGFRCPSSSKKGLLGLLGLLGLIPLLLLCCCLFFLCCIRRRKTEADVHFATFDPHAAPVIATAPCATATACPTAFGATPFATHPSAIPCL